MSQKIYTVCRWYEGQYNLIESYKSKDKAIRAMENIVREDEDREYVRVANEAFESKNRNYEVRECELF